MQQHLNPLLCGFRQCHGTQYALSTYALQTWQIGLVESSSVEVVLMDLSKAFGCLPPDLIIVKLPTYCFCRVNYH